MNMEKCKKLISSYNLLPVQIKASFWFLICSFLQSGIAIITTPIFTRLMSTSEYGNYGTFNSWMGIITIIVSINLSSGVFMQGLVKFSNERDLFASSLQGLNFTLCIFWTIIYLLFHHYINLLLGLTTIQMASMIIMIWANAAFSFWLVEQRVLLKYQKLVVITAISSIVQPIVGILFVFLSTDKVTGRILGQMFAQVACYAWFFFIQLKKGKYFFSKKYWLYALSFNLPLVLHYLSQTVLNCSDRIMIKKMIGSSEAGVYSLANSLSNIMLLFNVALLQTLSPWMFQKIKEKKIEQISTIAYSSLIIIAAVNILLITFAPEVVAIFAPESYMEAIWIIPPIAMSVYFVFSYTLYANFEFYYKKTTHIMIASVIGASLNILLNYIFLNIFGYYAAGYTTLVCYIIYSFA
ncbi:MAG: oligosaccharide flippase family protein, partial [Lachnospiraceae bacterium]|nr:oligosaccharide flippase family protein [Lachnospiraceae bacterium]